MSPTPASATVASRDAADPAPPPASPAVPGYLHDVYWWAYVHPRAVAFFERDWLVNAILFGNYGRLRDAAVESLGEPLEGRTLQVACVYGDLTARVQRRLAPDARLDVVDIVPAQLANLAAKIEPDARVHPLLGDSSALPLPTASVDQLLLFFLLHEQPPDVRRATLAEAMRVVKPGGRLVLVDYHRPAWWHPMRLLMRLVFARLEPFAMDLWRSSLVSFLPPDLQPAKVETKRLFFGGLYQHQVWTR